jgi:isochorismate synthase EntC
MSDLKSTSPFTYTSAVEYHSNTLCSIECGASILLDLIPSINRYWILENNHREGSIIRIRVDCCADIEAGTSISGSFLSNLSQNAQLLPDTERALFVSRKGTIGILAYGSCKRLHSISEVHEVSKKMSSEILTIGGEAFDEHERKDSKLNGWLVPLVEIRSEIPQSLTSTSSGSVWPHVTLAVNILIPSNNRSNDLKLQLTKISDLLRNIKWDFRYTHNNLCQLPPLIGDMRDTGMTEEHYTTAVESCLTEMRGGVLKKVVYAVRKTGTALSSIDAVALLMAVAKGTQSDESKRYTLLFAPNGLNEEIFISLSPEQLCKVDGDNISTEALAGTYPRDHIEKGTSHIIYYTTYIIHHISYIIYHKS